MSNRNISVLTWFNFFTDFKLYAPIAIIYFSQITGSYALGMSIFSIVFISSAVAELPTGILSDFVGRRKTMIFGALSAVCYSIFYAIGISYGVLVVGAILEGISRAFYSGTSDALLHDTLAEQEKEAQYGEYLGKVSSMFQISLATSAVLGGFLAEWSFSLIMWISVLSQLICLVLAFRFTDPAVKSEKNNNIFAHIREASKKFASNYKLRLLSIASMYAFALGEAMYQFQAIFYQSVWPVWAIGVAKMAGNVGAAVSFRFSGALIRRFGAIKILLASNFYSRIVNSIALLYPTILSPLLMSTGSLWYGVTSVSKNSLMQREFSTEQRATMGSLNALGGSILFAIVSFALGYLADTVSPANALLLFQILLLPLIALYALLFRKSRVDSSRS